MSRVGPIAGTVITGDAEIASPLCMHDTPAEGCYLEYILARTPTGLVFAGEHFDGGVELRPEVLDGGLNDLSVNGNTLDPAVFRDGNGSLTQIVRFGPDQTVTLAVKPTANGFRRFPPRQDYEATFIFRRHSSDASYNFDNGIQVAPAKLYDTTALRQQLLNTASQLSALNPFNNASLLAAQGALQGITRDTSFLSAQLTTTPTASVISNNPASTDQTITITCPAGFVPANLSGTASCAAATPATTIPTTATIQTTGTPTASTTGTQISTPSLTGTVAPTPPSSPLAAPTNVGVSSTDLFSEQTQLSAQFTILRTLLAGADSDQYLSAGDQFIGMRDQATLGFAVNITPPRQYKNAAAEVRIIVVPPTGYEPVSVANLLPAEKTYNVARITSRQDSFGAGVAVSPVNVGVSTGRSKDRLYLARDTDTIAVLYAPDSVEYSYLPTHYRLRNGIHGLADRRSESCPGPADPEDNAVIFGWQFRPVLGEPYVRPGIRQVFAQLALPARVDDTYQPTIYVQTLWREYDEKKRVLGAVYLNSCTRVEQPGALVLHAPLRTRDLRVEDLGGGQLRLHASGEYFASGMVVHSGTSLVPPTRYDGRSLEITAAAKDLLTGDDLTLISETGYIYPFAIEHRKDLTYPLISVTANALPKPDGNSLVAVRVALSSQLASNPPQNMRTPKPLIVIGSTVYGLQETPLSESCDTTGLTCEYTFAALSSVLDAARKLTFVDLTRQGIRATKDIAFGPSFSALNLDTTPSGDTASYMLTGKNLDHANLNPRLPLSAAVAPSYCVFTVAHGVLINPVASSRTSDSLVFQNFNSSSMAAPKEIALRVAPASTCSPDAPGVVQWTFTLPIKAPDTPTLEWSPKSLGTGDSRIVTLSGIDFTNFKSAQLNGQNLVATLSKDKKKVELLMSTALTKDAGEKEISLDLGDGDAHRFIISITRKN